MNLALRFFDGCNLRFVRTLGRRAALIASATLVAASVMTLAAADAPTRITIDLAHPGHAVSPMLHGVFFEDINYGADGGLYAELVQNRSFEHRDSLFAWSTVNRGGQGLVTVETDGALNDKNPHYVRLDTRELGSGFGIANLGYGGIALSSGENYLFSVRARQTGGTTGSGLQIILEDETGRQLGATNLTGLTAGWQKLEGSLKSSATALHARLVVLATAPGQVDLDVISLFPEHTWKARRNGLRADLVQMLADLQPAFLRFPGGCIVEGMDLPNRYQWKETIGDIAERPQNWNRWQDAIRSQPAPQYYQTYGLGFFEYFQLCEDLGAAPVPILNCGMACQYESKQLVPMDKLDPFVQDALDLVEFANGSVATVWGAKRAALGHPASFNLKYVGVGNEQWGEDYFARYHVFQTALKKRYPDLQLVTTAGPGVDNEQWKLAWDKFRNGTLADVVDEHYYRSPQWFLENATRYDATPRTGTKIFAGEYAAHDGKTRKASLRAAIAEAAFMTGLVRNSDVVSMASYAPLLAKAGAWQWAPDLIWFDNTRVYGTPSYYVQALFSRNRPDVVLPVTVAGPTVRLTTEDATRTGAELGAKMPAALSSVFAAAGRDDHSGETIIFLVNPYDTERKPSVELRGAVHVGPVRSTTLTSSSPDDENTFDSSRRVSPVESTFSAMGGAFSPALPAYSLTVLRVKTGN